MHKHTKRYLLSLRDSEIIPFNGENKIFVKVRPVKQSPSEITLSNLTSSSTYCHIVRRRSYYMIVKWVPFNVSDRRRMSTYLGGVHIHTANLQHIHIQNASLLRMGCQYIHHHPTILLHKQYITYIITKQNKKYSCMVDSFYLPPYQKADKE